MGRILSYFFLAALPRFLLAAAIIVLLLVAPLAEDRPAGDEIGSFRVGLTAETFLSPALGCIDQAQPCVAPMGGVIGWSVLAIALIAIMTLATAIISLFLPSITIITRALFVIAAIGAAAAAIMLLLTAGVTASWGILIAALVATVGAIAPVR